MAEDQGAEEETDGGEEEGEGGGSKKLSGKRLVMFIALPILLLGGIGAGVFFSGLADPLLGKEQVEGEGADAEEEVVEQGPPVYFDLPQMLVNLNSTGRKSNFLKIVVSLELPSEEDVYRLEEVMPRVVDNFQVYLRELRVEDLRGSSGLYRLREELLLRVNTAIQPAHVNDVLFKEMLVQ